MNAELTNKNDRVASRASKCLINASVLAGMLAIGVMWHSNLSLAKDKALPFRASFSAEPTGLLTVAGNGIASHLGVFELNVSRAVATTPSPSNPCVGFVYIDANLTAANGDELRMRYTDGELCFDFTNFPVVSFAGVVNFAGTGGSGRFLGSTGAFEMFWSGETSPLGTTTDGTIDGVIVY